MKTKYMSVQYKQPGRNTLLASFHIRLRGRFLDMQPTPFSTLIKKILFYENNTIVLDNQFMTECTNNNVLYVDM